MTALRLFAILAAAGALLLPGQDWPSLAAQAKKFDREAARVRPVITPFCGQGDWYGQFIGYRPPGSKDWTKIRLMSDAGKYSRGVVDMYPAIGYVHQVRENIEFVAGGPGWDETRVLVSSDGVARGERRSAGSKRGLSGAKWEPMSADEASSEAYSSNDARRQLDRDWSRSRVSLVGTEAYFSDPASAASPDEAPEICDAAVTPEIQLRLERSPDLLKKPVAIRLELRKVRLNRVEGVLTHVEPTP